MSFSVTNKQTNPSNVLLQWLLSDIPDDNNSYLDVDVSDIVSIVSPASSRTLNGGRNILRNVRVPMGLIIRQNVIHCAQWEQTLPFLHMHTCVCVLMVCYVKRYILIQALEITHMLTV